MPEALAPLEFSLEDVIGGIPLTPETVDLPTLRSFLEEVETLVKGDVPGAQLAGSRVRVEEGSLRVKVLVSVFLATNATADLAKLEATGDLDLIHPRRAQVLERWQARARRSEQRSYSVRAEGLPVPLRIHASSQFEHRGEAGWVEVEKYLVGKVVDLGGKQDPNVHLVLTESSESLRISASEQQLAAEEENQLYKLRTLRVRAEQNLRTKALRNLRLLQFLPQSDEPDEAALAALWRKGREAWKDVPSATAWVEELRGTP
ncbi:MAG: hypothetical protein JSR82_23830 [Verrucomicrobia bacterium]|nr:hypothetical protein [Verrucomicrobiota bacterium]